MKKQKFSLKELRIQSFVTRVNNVQVDKFKAGAFDESGPDYCCSKHSDCASDSPSCATNFEAPIK